MTSLSYTSPIQKPSKNIGKLTCVFGRFKNPFFLWLIQILKAVTVVMVTAIAFFWSFMRNPAIAVLVAVLVRDVEHVTRKYRLLK
jgi:hypothetical protein